LAGGQHWNLDSAQAVGIHLDAGRICEAADSRDRYADGEPGSVVERQTRHLARLSYLLASSEPERRLRRDMWKVRRLARCRLPRMTGCQTDSMAELKERLRADLTTSMRERDELQTATIRMALAAVTNAEVAGAQARELSDDEVLAVLTKEAKKRREAADAFRDGGRPDRAEREEAEAAVIADYLPTPLTDDELAELVDSAVAEVGATSMRDMGAVMKQLSTRVTGRADGRVVATAVRSRLSGA
jgi:uncharacterized protein